MPRRVVLGGLAIAAALLIALTAGGCGSRVDGSVALSETGSPDPELFSFAPPSGLLRSVSADNDRCCYGADFAAELPNQRVAMQFTQLIFLPTWNAGSDPDLDDLAYAMYLFALAGYAGPPELTIRWSTPPPDWSCCFVGMGNQQRKRWDWFGDVDISDGMLTLDSLAPYLDGEGRLIMAVVMTGTDVCTLSWLRWGGNVAPAAELTADPVFGAPPLVVSFDASGSSDLDGTVDNYAWDFNENGAYSEPGDEADALGSPTASHTYSDLGEYTATVRVTDNEGATDEAGVEIQVAEPPNEPPVAVLTADPVWGEPPLMGSFSAADSYDPDGTIENYEWDLNGDGQYGESEEEADAEGDATVAYSYTEEGTYIAWVRVTDDEDAADTAVAYVNVTSAGRGDWWMFGHDLQHTHRSPYVGAQTNNVKWTFPTGGYMYSSPSVASDGTVYVGSDDHKLHAINPDGSLKWSYSTQFYVKSSPAIGADGTVYVGSNDMKLHAINPDGSLRWSYETEGSVSSSPAIASDGTVYVGSNDDNLYAINPDGSLKWSYPTGDDVTSSPAIASDGTVYVGSNDAKLYAINPDGTFEWSYVLETIWTGSPAIGTDGTVYIGGDRLYAINPDGTFEWSYSEEVHGCSPAVGADGTVYVGSRDAHKLYAINQDGSHRWSYDAGAKLNFSSPAIGADGTVYVGTWHPDAKFHAVNPDGSHKWSYDFDSQVRTSPALGPDGTVYVGTGFPANALYAFGPDS